MSIWQTLKLSVSVSRTPFVPLALTFRQCFPNHCFCIIIRCTPSMWSLLKALFLHLLKHSRTILITWLRPIPDSSSFYAPERPPGNSR